MQCTSGPDVLGLAAQLPPCRFWTDVTAAGQRHPPNPSCDPAGHYFWTCAVNARPQLCLAQLLGQLYVVGQKGLWHANDPSCNSYPATLLYAHYGQPGSLPPGRLGY